jgi:cystathionine beta-lyase/cystathionine gamma-synthase
MRGTPPYPGTLVRFSIGLESAAALKADLEQALRVLA